MFLKFRIEVGIIPSKGEEALASKLDPYLKALILPIEASMRKALEDQLSLRVEELKSLAGPGGPREEVQ